MNRHIWISAADGWYHTTARGDNRERICDDDRDRKEFVARMEEMTRRLCMEVQACVLMPNH